MTHLARAVSIRLVCLAACALLAAGTLGAAQQTVPFRNNTPIAPQGIPVVVLPTAPVTFDTAEGQRIKVVVVARGLARPWGLAFLPGGDLLVTERGGRLRIIRYGALDPAPVAGAPTVQAQGLSGLMDIALHPRFSENPLVTSDPSVRFYAGAPITAGNGQKIGMLCVLDHQPRQFTDAERAKLTSLARQVEAEISR